MESWIHISKNSGAGDSTVTITVDTNDTLEERSAIIDVRTSTLNKELKINQKPLELESMYTLKLNGPLSGTINTGNATLLKDGLKSYPYDIASEVIDNYSKTQPKLPIVYVSWNEIQDGITMPMIAQVCSIRGADNGNETVLYMYVVSFDKTVKRILLYTDSTLEGIIE